MKRLKLFEQFTALNEAEWTSINDIPDLRKKVDAGQVTYRGLPERTSKELYKATQLTGTRIKVDGKEYFITDEDFRELAWDEKKKGWNGKIRFAAPHRRS